MAKLLLSVKGLTFFFGGHTLLSCRRRASFYITAAWIASRIGGGGGRRQKEEPPPHPTMSCQLNQASSAHLPPPRVFSFFSFSTPQSCFFFFCSVGTAGRAHALGLLPFFFLFFFGGRWGAPVVVGTHPVVVTAGRKLKKKKKERDNEERNGWRPIAGVLYAMEYTWRGSCPDAVFSSLFFLCPLSPSRS